MHRLSGPLLAILLLWTVSARPALAQEPAPEPTLLQQVDGWFGRVLVAPLATVLFWDVAFWDDSLPPGEGVGTTVGDERVTGWDQGNGYTYQEVVEVPRGSLVAAPLDPVDRAYGPVTVRISAVDGALQGEVQPGTLDPAALGLPQVEGHPDADPLADWMGPPPRFVAPPADADAVWPVVGVAPFPVFVEVVDGAWRLVPTRVDLPADALPVDLGGRVAAPGGAVGLLEAVSDDGQATLLSDERRMDAARLPNPAAVTFPIVVAWLVLGAVFFTLRMQFVSLWAFGHAVAVTRGAYDNPNDPGEISHFQALSSALSATVGLGNIAGVAIAVSLGGPGAVFWMIVAGFLGMSSKFVEVTLGQMYRVIDPVTGRVSGGPMRYLHTGLAELGLGPLGRVLAVVFAVMCIGGSLGGGNMFQANQSYQAVADLVPVLKEYPSVYGVALAVLVAAVIIGGIKRIGLAASAIVPLMCGIYLLAGLVVVVVNADRVPWALQHIVTDAFNPEGVVGGAVGTLVQGFRRAAFSNEAGVGSASIAHSAATTDEPVREGVVGLLEPFIDTIVVCTMTGVVVVVTGTYLEPANSGVLMTARAFATVLPWFPLVLSFAVFLFAFSTMISWSYYGERCWAYLFGEETQLVYRLLFVACVYLGSVISLGNVLDFSDLMVLGMAFPNILGAILLSGKVKAALDDYWRRYKAGAFTAR